ncbi:MAG: 1-deoxy-D-xylulose-5-phosphate reductoisomerase [Alloprevotella sp.]|nr:1-deoxy-D-xylulose-5-phosphate reductoisomerase [Alloprevotella sp.]
MRRICILGSTGSIGTQTLDIIRQHPDKFEAHTLTAGSNAELLIRQAREFNPDTIVIANEDKYDLVRDALSDLPIKVYSGAQALCEVVEAAPIDTVLTAMVGFAGLPPTVHALKAGKAVALANKETLVVAGEAIMRLAIENRCPILPVDSEHSAIFQSLNGEQHNRIEKILLTASGGPFRNCTVQELQGVTAEQALRHPNWTMGAKITIDSATMMNKGFELIEAKWLFGLPAQAIEVVIHPESVIHSAVQFEDGAVIAQLGTPDMHLPIQYALSYPARLPLPGARLDLFSLGALHFEQPDTSRFPCLRLAYEAIARGGSAPCVLNAANEIANFRFREGGIGFMDIPRIIEETLARVPFVPAPTLDDYPAINREARLVAARLTGSLKK